MFFSLASEAASRARTARVLLGGVFNQNLVRFFSLLSEAASRAPKRMRLSREWANVEVVQSQDVPSQAFTSQFSQGSSRADVFFIPDLADTWHASSSR